MEITVFNASSDPLLMEYQKKIFLMMPGESKSFVFSEKFCFKLNHLKSDKSGRFLYILSELVAYKKPRTKLDIDGEYEYNSDGDSTLIKVKNREYVFDKNLSYDVFIFNCNKIDCKKYYADEKEILKKCKLLFLVGGIRTFFPFSLITFVASLLGIFKQINNWENIVFAIISGIASMALGGYYLHSLGALRKFMKDSEIRKYMNSPRVEHRTLEDNIVQSYLDKETDNEVYW